MLLPQWGEDRSPSDCSTAVVSRPVDRSPHHQPPCHTTMTCTAPAPARRWSHKPYAALPQPEPRADELRERLARGTWSAEKHGIVVGEYKETIGDRVVTILSYAKAHAALAELSVAGPELPYVDGDGTAILAVGQVPAWLRGQTMLLRNVLNWCLQQRGVAPMVLDAFETLPDGKRSPRYSRGLWFIAVPFAAWDEVREVLHRGAIFTDTQIVVLRKDMPPVHFDQFHERMLASGKAAAAGVLPSGKSFSGGLQPISCERSDKWAAASVPCERYY